MYLGVNDIRQTEIHTPEPLVHKTSVFEVDNTIDKLERHKLPAIVQILADQIRR
jgi:hypothetical protein